MSILSKIQTGRIGRPQKIVIYAPEKFGKSSLGKEFPNPLFFDVDNGTSQMDVARLGKDALPDLKTFEGAIDEVVALKPCDTLVIDTGNSLESIIARALCDEYKQPSIESNDKGSPFAFGKGMVKLAEKFTIMLQRLDGVIKSGMNVVILAHSSVSKFEPPDGVSAYDRYELKLTKKVNALVKEWADILCFANYRTQIREKDKNESGEKFKAVGGKERVMYFSHCSAWDAGNRHGLGDAEPWGKDASEAIKVFERAFRTVGAPWGNSPTPAQPVKAAAVQQPEPVKSAPIEGVKDAGEVAANIVAELKPDEIPMHFDANGKGIVSPEEIEFHRICEPHEAAVNKYLLNSAAAAGRIQPGQTFRDVSIEYIKRVLKNPANFLKVVQSEGAK